MCECVFMCMVWYMWHVYLCVVCECICGVQLCLCMNVCDVVSMYVYVCVVCMCVSCMCVRPCPLALETVMFHDFAYHQGLSNFRENS